MHTLKTCVIKYQIIRMSKYIGKYKNKYNFFITIGHNQIISTINYLIMSVSTMIIQEYVLQLMLHIGEKLFLCIRRVFINNDSTESNIFV